LNCRIRIGNFIGNIKHGLERWKMRIKAREANWFILTMMRIAGGKEM
jgi:hypothetical protein